VKVLSVKIENFKQFQELELDFANAESGLPKDVVLIQGNNGSGKTTVMQAIAGVVGEATGRLKTLADLDWPGFDLELANTNWRRPIRIEVSLYLTDEELSAIHDFWQLLPRRESDWVAPSRERTVDLIYENGRVRAKQGAGAFFQCKGRTYARQIHREHPDGFRVFERVGYPFWYTDQRTSFSFTPDNGSLQATIEGLRSVLNNMATFHEQLTSGKRKLSPGHRDRFADLQTAFQKVFPERKLGGPAFSDDIDQALDPMFTLYDGRNEYELSEMSAGERAIFPILFDFVNWNLHRSIIMIDELELHLHPPIQQRLLGALQRLGIDNQIILTSHSDHVGTVVPNHAEIFLGAPR